jgi:hypothetical protein
MRVSKGAVDSARSGGFKLNGKSFAALPATSLGDAVRRIALKLPDDDLLDVEEMSARAGFNPIALASNVARLKCDDCMTLIRIGTRQRRVFGNPQTIKKLLASLERA